MKRAIISDIHANLEALTAVIEDIRAQEIREIYCLGDVVGYGPDPETCLDLVIGHCDVCLLGDQDEVFLRHLLAFRLTSDATQARIDYLRSRPVGMTEEKLAYVHASPRAGLSEYIFPEDVHHHRKMQANFARFAHHCFVGHTHLPGVFTEGFQFFTPEQLDNRYRLGPEKALINVGSVGQPRDGDLRACYVVLEGEWVTFRRVDYPFEQTIAKLVPPPKSDG